jgi:hypothetical protein
MNADCAFLSVTWKNSYSEKKFMVTIWMEGKYVSGEARINSVREMSAVGWFP